MSTDIKSKRHNLEKALKVAEEQGLALSNSTHFSIKVVNRAYNVEGENGFFFRYCGGESGNVETAEAIVASLNELLDQTAKWVDQPNATFDSLRLPFETRTNSGDHV